MKNNMEIVLSSVKTEKLSGRRYAVKKGRDEVMNYGWFEIIVSRDERLIYIKARNKPEAFDIDEKFVILDEVNSLDKAVYYISKNILTLYKLAIDYSEPKSIKAIFTNASDKECEQLLAAEVNRVKKQKVTFFVEDVDITLKNIL